MNLEAYKRKVKELENEFEMRKTKLMKEFVDINNPCKINDTVTDHMRTIRIEKMGYTWGCFGLPPSATYFGVELKKDGTPTKKGNKETVFQSNLISK